MKMLTRSTLFLLMLAVCTLVAAPAFAAPKYTFKLASTHSSWPMLSPPAHRLTLAPKSLPTW
jgi:hypothetical protein